MLGKGTKKAFSIMSIISYPVAFIKGVIIGRILGRKM